MSLGRVVLLGRLRIRGDRFHFEHADAREHEVAEGDPIELAVEYDYEEGSLEKERLRLTLAVEVAGIPIGGAWADVGDRPLLRDGARGILSHVLRMRRKGRAEGRFALEALYESAPWTHKAEPSETPFREASSFVLIVR